MSLPAFIDIIESVFEQHKDLTGVQSSYHPFSADDDALFIGYYKRNVHCAEVTAFRARFVVGFRSHASLPVPLPDRSVFVVQDLWREFSSQ